MKQNTIICRCEEVTYQDIYETAQHHQCTSREIKLRTRAGMGYCGGRTCRTFVNQIVAEASGEPVPDEIPLKYRPPVRPIPFKSMGGD